MLSWFCQEKSLTFFIVSAITCESVQ